jgi:ribosomal protein L44E
MVMSWSVVVRKETETVRLYCPECWDMAKKLVEETRDGSEDQISDV